MNAEGGIYAPSFDAAGRFNNESVSKSCDLWPYNYRQITLASSYRTLRHVQHSVLQLTHHSSKLPEHFQVFFL